LESPISQIYPTIKCYTGTLKKLQEHLLLDKTQWNLPNLFQKL